jgi:hypothetical protein
MIKIRKINKMKMNKRGWLRIVEAFLAILIVLGAVIVFMSSRQSSDTDISETVYERQRQILDVISKNDSLRIKVLSENEEDIKTAIGRMVPASWDFNIKICGMTEVCSTTVPYDRSVYVSESVVSSNLTIYEPKKIRFFAWMK